MSHDVNVSTPRVGSPAAAGEPESPRRAEGRLATWRAWRPGPAVVRATTLASLVMNVVILLTGCAVQLTDSGLGCPTWPECTTGSLVPTRALGYHSIIEFSNRMLTYVLCVAIGAAIIATMRARPRRRELVLLAWSLFAGVVAQAVVGGVSVLTHLSPTWVAVHFLVSIVLIALSYQLWVRSGESDLPPRPVVRRDLTIAARVLTGAMCALLVAGTVVTGSGPHSGAKVAARRFAVSPQTATQFHADLVFLVTGLTVALWFGLRATAAPAGTRAAVRDLFLLLMAQGAVGYVQYFTKLPVGLVELHMVGACLVWIATLRVLVRMRVRPVEAPAGHEAPNGTPTRVSPAGV